MIAGEGPQRPLIEKRLGSERIHLLGHRDDVPEVMAAMDCFVLPSYANEGVPQAVMQAMSMGLPVISTRVGAIDEAVIEGETGVFVPARDAQALAAAMLEISGSPEKIRSMGKKGRAIAEQRFSIGKMIDAMERVFLSVR